MPDMMLHEVLQHTQVVGIAPLPAVDKAPPNRHEPCWKEEMRKQCRHSLHRNRPSPTLLRYVAHLEHASVTGMGLRALKPPAPSALAFSSCPSIAPMSSRATVYIRGQPAS